MTAQEYSDCQLSILSKLKYVIYIGSMSGIVITTKLRKRQ